MAGVAMTTTKTRLFIGNLAATVTDAELREKFEGLLQSHRNEAEVGDVEVRCKNENNYFGYVDIHLKNQQNGGSQEGPSSFSKMPLFVRKCIDIMNNTKWKGSLIKVQLAKESFIEKLRREQAANGYANNRPNNSNSTRDANQNEQSEKSRISRQANDILHKLNKSKEKIEKGARARIRNRNNFIDKKDNYNFEIVSSNSNTDSSSKAIKSPKKSEAFQKRKRKKYNSSSSEGSEDDDDDQVRDGIPKFKGLLACYPDGPPPPTPPVESKERSPSPEERPAIQQKLLSIAFDNTPDKNKKIINRDLDKKRVEIVEKEPVKAPGTGINFKKSKQEKSDLLRLQSLEKLKELKTQRSNLIKSSLSQVTAVPATSLTNRKEIDIDIDEEDEEMEGEEVTVTVTPKSNKNNKTSKSAMTLFDDDEDDDDNDKDSEADLDPSAFKVRKQFEGATGQRLLELQTGWGNDERFKIDSRFKESDNEEEGNDEVNEKEKQFNILTDILGKVVTSTSTSSSSGKKKGKATSSTNDTFSSVILPRYDPEAEEVEVENKPSDVSESPKKKGEKEEGKNDEVKEVKDRPIRSTEPVTFKTVSNLKALFSSEPEPDSASASDDKPVHKFGEQKQSSTSSFSLLATFGKPDVDDEGDEDGGDGLKHSKKSEPASLKSGAGPRSFWQSNPFKYDSSDDEDEDDQKKKAKAGDKVTVTINTKPENGDKAELVILGKMPFFFAKNDARFEGLEDYFLKEDVSSGSGGCPADTTESSGNKKEGVGSGATVSAATIGGGGGALKAEVEDFSVKRQELKAIVKAKIRNSKRKDEKRTLAIKRAIRKRKRKMHNKISRKF